MKKLIMVTALIVGCNLVWIAMLSFSKNQFAWLPWKSFDKKDQISIALVGPMTGDGFIDGRDMVRGARMAIQDAVAAGRLSDKEIRLNFFDDKNDVSAAVQAASEITLNNEDVAVLGHYSSTTSIAAGAIYQKNRIPMITGSATEENVTDKNSWAFGIIPGNFDQSVSIISHLMFLKRPVSIIYETGGFYNSFLRGIEKNAAEAGIEILYKWKISATEKNGNNGLENILRDLKTVRYPGVIIISADSQNTATIINSINHPSTDFTIIGTDSVATGTFYNALTSRPREKAQPGYYLNGIYGTTPFLPELAGPEANRFIEAYQVRFGRRPGWVAASYYDAMKVLIEAIELKHINGRDVRENRAMIRSALSQFTDQEQAVKGVTGPIFFDKKGRVQGLYRMGYYENQHFHPAFTQYSEIARKENNAPEKSPEKFIDQKEPVLGSRVIGRKNLVFAGMDLISVDSVNSATGEFFVNFYIWFRFKGEFNEQHIVFENAETPIRLAQPVLETRQDDFTIRAYEAKGKFKQIMTYENFPFEKYRLAIRFHHKQQTGRNLVFIPDYLSMQARLSPKAGQNHMEDSSTWKVGRVTQSRDTVEKQFGSEKQVFSRYNAHIQIQRIDRFFPLKILVPLLALVFFLSLNLFVPFDHFGTRLLIIFCVEISAGIWHYCLRFLHPSGNMMLVQVNFYAVYALGILSALVFLNGIRLQKINEEF